MLDLQWYSGISNLCGKYIRADKICDAVEVAGKNVMSTTAVVTTGLVSHRYICYEVIDCA